MFELQIWALLLASLGFGLMAIWADKVTLDLARGFIKAVGFMAGAAAYIYACQITPENHRLVVLLVLFGLFAAIPIFVVLVQQASDRDWNKAYGTETP